MTIRIGLKTEATELSGFGHLKRLLNLITGWSGISPTFISSAPLPEIGCKKILVDSAQAFLVAIKDLDLLIIDEPQLDASFLKVIPPQLKLAGFDELGELRDQLHIHFVTTLLGLDNYIQQRGITREYIGPDYFIFPEPESPATKIAGRNILVTFGGSDPVGLSLEYCLRMNDSMLKQSVMILGPGFNRKHLEELRKQDKLHFIENPSSLVPYYRAYPITVTGGGVSAYEAIRFGSRTFLCSQHAEQLGTACRLSERGLALQFNAHPQVNWSDLNSLLTKYIVDEYELSAEPDEPAFFDGLGTQRVRRILEEYAQS